MRQTPLSTEYFYYDMLPCHRPDREPSGYGLKSLVKVNFFLFVSWFNLGVLVTVSESWLMCYIIEASLEFYGILLCVYSINFCMIFGLFIFLELDFSICSLCSGFEHGDVRLGFW